MSTFIKDFVEKEKINRRNFLLASATGLGSMAMPAAFGSGAAFAATDPALAWSYRDRASAYWNAIVSGGETFVESLGKTKADMTSLINEGSSEKSLADIKAFLAKNSGNCAIACDANDSPNARPVAEAVKEAGGYVSTIWNKTDDLHPWDIGDNYVCHLSWSGEKPSEEAARVLGPHDETAIGHHVPNKTRARLGPDRLPDLQWNGGLPLGRDGRLRHARCSLQTVRL